MNLRHLLDRASFPAAALVAVFVVVSARPCVSAAPLNKPANAAAARIVRELFFIRVV